MKISYQWLGRYIHHGLSAEEVATRITGGGLEVEEITPFSTSPNPMHGLVTGKVISVEKHPDADKLSLTLVDVGRDNPLKIVCGAPNVAVGQNVCVAEVGAELHPSSGESFIIKKSKIRGAESEGMLCAEDEIGLGADHSGIMVLPADTPVGIPFIDYLKPYTDSVFEIAITPNRSDAASHIGIARDLAALTGNKVVYPAVEKIKNTVAPKVEIIIEAPQECPRYSGLVVKNIEVNESPEWLKNSLKAIGLTPINNVVDVTNFVLHEMGHPLHAFDLEKVLGNKIIIRKSKPGEKFTTLDKTERTLDGSELMIANAEKPMALAGVFGGLDSGITSATKNIFIESAYFHPVGIRRTSRKHQLFTDASFRYERGADPNATETAALRAAQLITEVAGGEIQPLFYDAYPVAILPVEVRLDFDFVNKIAGDNIPSNDVVSILKGLEIEITASDEKGVMVRIPTFKTDVTRPIDLVEEIMRVYSYDKIQLNHTIRTIQQTDKNYYREKLKKKITGLLTSHGFSEAYILSFVGEDENVKSSGSVPVLNPISAETSWLRNNSVIPGLKCIAHNLNRQMSDVKLFEFGSYYLPGENGYRQKNVITLWATGNTYREHWQVKNHEADFYFIKGMMQQILRISCKEIKEETEAKNEFTSYGINWNNYAEAGKIDNAILKKFGVDKDVFFAEIDLDKLAKENKTALQFKPLYRFPKVERDLSLLVPDLLKYEDIKSRIKAQSGKLLQEVFIFDVYQGKQVKEGYKSYGIRMEFRDEKQTLEDKRIDKLMQNIIAALEKELGVEVR